MQLEDETCRVLFLSLDIDGDGSVSYEEFKNSFRDHKMSGPRMAAVQKAFRQLNREGQLHVPFESFCDIYDPSSHPDVKSGIVSKRQCVHSILQFFECQVRGCVDVCSLDQLFPVNYHVYCIIYIYINRCNDVPSNKCECLNVIRSRNCHRRLSLWWNSLIILLIFPALRLVMMLS